MNIRNKSMAVIITSSQLVVLTICVAALAILIFNISSNRGREQLKKEETLIADQLAISLALPLWNFDRDQMDKIMESAMQNRIVFSIAVTPLTSDTQTYGKKRDKDWRIVEADKIASQDGMRVHERDIQFQNEKIGRVTVFITPKFFEAFLRTNFQLMFIIFVPFLLILSLFLYFVIWNLIVRPLKEVEQFGATVSAGEEFAFSNLRVPFYGELGNVRQSIEKMVATLKSRNRKLQEEIELRQVSEETLEKLSHKISLILNSASEGIYGLDLEGKVTFINLAGVRMLGYEAEEITGRQSHTIWHHHSTNGTILPVEQCSLNEVLKKGSPGLTESGVFWKKDGTNFQVEYSSTPMFEADKLVGAVVTFKDITIRLLEEQERNKLENQLRQAQKMEAVGTLAGGIAHDFNNMLNVIIGYGTMLMDRIGGDLLSKEQMNEVLAAADRAANLTRRLLIFSRKQAVEVKPVNVNEIISGMEKMLSRIITEDIAFTLELTSRKIIVMADTGQIEQVLMNLVSNAKYAMQKGGRLTIITGIKEMDDEYITAYGYGKPGTYALISVRDTGSGMDAETQEKIFEPFFTTKGIGEGTGLGLSIVYGIIEQHNGYIKVYSEPGKGTEFKIYLPLIEEEIAIGQEVEAVAPIKGGTETILLAEDDASLRKLSRVVLEAAGYTVITAEDGEEAITRHMENRHKIQLVILDMIMPKKNGKEAYAEIKKISSDIKVLFVSGYTMDIINKKELLDEGMDYILKPVSPKDLVEKVRKALDKL